MTDDPDTPGGRSDGSGPAAARRLPSVTLHTRERDEGRQPNPFRWAPRDSLEIMGRGRVVVFSLPAAFSPTCSDRHLPAVDEAVSAFREAGADAVLAIAVNDAFTLFQWGRHLGVERVTLVPDGNGDFTRAMGMLVSRRHLGYGLRSWRHAFVADEGRVVAWFEEPGIEDDGGTDDDPYDATRPERVLGWLRANPRAAAEEAAE